MPADPYPPIAVTSPPVMVTFALLPVRSYPYEPPIPAPNLPPRAVTTPPVMVMFEPLLMNPPMPAPGSLPTAVTVPPAMVMFEPFCLRSPPMPAAPPPSAKSEPCPDTASGFSPFRRPAWPKVDVREFSPSITRSSPPDATENAAPGFSPVRSMRTPSMVTWAVFPSPGSTTMLLSVGAALGSAIEMVSGVSLTTARTPPS